MRCNFIKKNDQLLTCKYCGFNIPISLANKKINSICKSRKPNKMPISRPGTLLKIMLEQLGFKEGFGCNCSSMIGKMDKWGPDKCLQKIDEIVAHLEKNKKLAKWWELARAGTKALALGWPLTIRGLVEKAIEDSRSKE